MVAAGRTLLAIIGLVASVGLVNAPAGVAHDSLAPAGASHRWLPDDEEWVYRHWIPFDERRLNLALGLRRGELEAHLYNDHRVIADLARHRGLDLEALADHLVEPWRSRVDAARVAVLRERTIRLLTQGHLAQHLFFHVFHGVGIASAARTLFGTSPIRFLRLRQQRHRPLQIAKRNGLSERRVRNRLAQHLRATRDEGLARQEAWPSESTRVLRRQLRAVACWLRTPMPAFDPGNPYGKARRQHGRHPRRWPFTAAQRRKDDRRVERVRRSLRRSCWRRPGPFSGRLTRGE
jgi:hypothetical protein